MWSNQETFVRKQVKNPCEAERYAMHSSGKNSLAAGLSPYKIAKMDAFASKLAGRLFLPFCIARRVHKIFTKKISTHLLIMEVDFCPALCIAEMPILRAF